MTTPVSGFTGIIYKQFWIDDLCYRGPDRGFVFCGGNDYYAPGYGLFQITPTRYSTDVVRVNRTTTVPLPFEEYDVDAIRRTYELCCGAQFGGTAEMRGTWTVSVSNIPEPATWMMMLFGFGAIGASMRAKRHRKASHQLASA